MTQYKLTYILARLLTCWCKRANRLRERHGGSVVQVYLQLWEKLTLFILLQGMVVVISDYEYNDGS